MNYFETEIAAVEPFSRRLEEKILGWDRPFGKPSGLIAASARMAGQIAGIAEGILGERLFVSRRTGAFEHFPPRLHRTLRDLYASGALLGIQYPLPPGDWPHIPALQLATNRGVRASGYGFDWEAAAIRGTAELLERHSVISHGGRQFIRGSWHGLARHGAADPRRFLAFSERQRHASIERAFDEYSEFNWLPARSFLSGAAYMVPAQLCYLSYQLFPGEPRIRKAQGSGVAARPAPNEAAYHAITEAIERDAIMIHWLNRISPPRIALQDVLNPAVRKAAAMFSSRGLELVLLDLTTDISVPTVMAAIREQGRNRPLAHLAACADLDPETAAEHAALEAISVGYAAPPLPEERELARTDPAHIRSHGERIAFWSDPAREHELDFLFSNSNRAAFAKQQRFSTSSAKARELRRILSESGLDAYLADITSPATRNAGLTVLSALIPELYPLYLDEQYRYLGLPRLYEAPVRMGVFSSPKSEQEMNPLPHPFL